MHPKVRVLIGENEFGWGIQCAKFLDPFQFDTRVTEHDALKILDEIFSFRPDIVILPALIKNISAIGMIEVFHHVEHLLNYHPKFIVIHSQRNPHLEQTVMAHGAYHYQEKPFTYHLICDYIREIVKLKKKETFPSSQSYEEIISEILWEMKIPANIKGFRYLRKAILLSMFDLTLLESITKELYPAIAAEYKTSTVSVERSIRNAISHAWNECGSEVFKQYFRSLEKKPSNGQFISMIADRMRMEYHLEHQKNDLAW